MEEEIKQLKQLLIKGFQEVNDGLHRLESLVEDEIRNRITHLEDIVETLVDDKQVNDNANETVVNESDGNRKEPAKLEGKPNVPAMPTGKRAAFEDMLEVWIDYRKNNRTTVIPKSLSRLSHWVRDVRKSYRDYLNGQPSNMTAEKIQLLKQANFNFNTNSVRKSNKKAVSKKVAVTKEKIGRNVTTKEVQPEMPSQPKTKEAITRRKIMTRATKRKGVAVGKPKGATEDDPMVTSEVIRKRATEDEPKLGVAVGKPKGDAEDERKGAAEDEPKHAAEDEPKGDAEDEPMVGVTVGNPKGAAEDEAKGDAEDEPMVGVTVGNPKGAAEDEAKGDAEDEPMVGVAVGNPKGAAEDEPKGDAEDEPKGATAANKRKASSRQGNDVGEAKVTKRNKNDEDGNKTKATAKRKKVAPTSPRKITRARGKTQRNVVEQEEVERVHKETRDPRMNVHKFQAVLADFKLAEILSIDYSNIQDSDVAIRVGNPKVGGNPNGKPYEITYGFFKNYSRDERLVDEPLDAYMNILESKYRNSKQVVIYNHTFFDTNIKEGFKNGKKESEFAKNLCGEKEKLLLPIHDANHWFLFAIDTVNKEVILYDSLGGGQKFHCRRMMIMVRDFTHNDRWRLVQDADKDIARQKDNWSCGYFTCFYAHQHITGGSLRPWEQGTYNEKLKKIKDHVFTTLVGEKLWKLEI